MQIILNLKSPSEISKIVQIRSNLFVTYFLFYFYKIFTRAFCILKKLTNVGSYDHP